MNYQALKPVNSRKSFYGKAQLITEGNALKCKSYNTIVAEYDKETKKLTIKGWYSKTTATHINSFLSFCGLPQMTKKEMEQH